MTHLFRYGRFLVSLLGIVGAGWLLAGCGTTDPEPAHVQTEARPHADLTSDLLRVGDVVTIGFAGVSNPPAEHHDERIKDDGRIALPYIEPIEAAGKTRSELQEAIHAAYVPKYYQHLTVTVGSESRAFYVEGQVKNPGRYNFAGEMSVLKCVAAAGDFTDFAKRSHVEVTRANGKKETINCKDAQKHPEKDIAIYPDDRIFVPRRYF